MSSFKLILLMSLGIALQWNLTNSTYLKGDSLKPVSKEISNHDSVDDSGGDSLKPVSKEISNHDSVDDSGVESSDSLRKVEDSGDESSALETLGSGEKSEKPGPLADAKDLAAKALREKVFGPDAEHHSEIADLNVSRRTKEDWKAVITDAFGHLGGEEALDLIPPSPEAIAAAAVYLGQGVDFAKIMIGKIDPSNIFYASPIDRGQIQDMIATGAIVMAPGSMTHLTIDDQLKVHSKDKEVQNKFGMSGKFKPSEGLPGVGAAMEAAGVAAEASAGARWQSGKSESSNMISISQSATITIATLNLNPDLLREKDKDFFTESSRGMVDSLDDFCHGKKTGECRSRKPTCNELLPYMGFFNMYGTKSVNQVVLGGKVTLVMKMTKEEFLKKSEREISGDLAAVFESGGVAATIGASHKKVSVFQRAARANKIEVIVEGGSAGIITSAIQELAAGEGLPKDVWTAYFASVSKNLANIKFDTEIDPFTLILGEGSRDYKQKHNSWTIALNKRGALLDRVVSTQEFINHLEASEEHLLEMAREERPDKVYHDKYTGTAVQRSHYDWAYQLCKSRQNLLKDMRGVDENWDLGIGSFIGEDCFHLGPTQFSAGVIDWDTEDKHNAKEDEDRRKAGKEPPTETPAFIFDKITIINNWFDDDDDKEGKVIDGAMGGLEYQDLGRKGVFNSARVRKGMVKFLPFSHIRDVFKMQSGHEGVIVSILRVKPNKSGGNKYILTPIRLKYQSDMMAFVRAMARNRQYFNDPVANIVDKASGFVTSGKNRVVGSFSGTQFLNYKMCTSASGKELTILQHMQMNQVFGAGSMHTSSEELDSQRGHESFYSTNSSPSLSEDDRTSPLREEEGSSSSPLASRN